jgi:hypothetical protein
MVQFFATKEELVNLVELYLAEVQSGAYEAIGIVAYNADTNTKHALLTDGANAVGFLGTLRILQSELEEEIKDLSQKAEEEERELVAITNQADMSKPQ